MISQNINNIKQKLNDKLRLIAVSKTRNIQELQQAIGAKQYDFGENYLQEALIKIKTLKDKKIIWHFIGSIQSNKTADIAENFDWVHSIDRLKIAKKLNNARPANLAKLNILIQINIDNEVNKSGIKLIKLEQLINDIKKLNNLKLCGLMCIPQQNNIKKSFKIMQQLKQQYKLKELSMGMSNDWETAINYGATMIRIGTAIFGKRI